MLIVHHPSVRSRYDDTHDMYEIKNVESSSSVRSRVPAIELNIATSILK